MFSLKIQRDAKGKIRKKWRLFHATDFQSLMYPCFTVCRILGMFPYKINASTFEASKPRYILTTMIICVYCVFYLLFIHGIITSKIIGFNNLTKNLEIICYFTFNGLLMIITHILSNPRMRLLQTISEVYSKLPLESHQMLSRLIHMKDILGITLLVMQGYLYFSKVQVFEMSYWTVSIIAFAMHLGMLGFQMNMLYMNCICILKACFKKIDDDLMHMQSDMINDIKLFVPSSTCHMWRNKSFCIKIKTLMKQHLMISETMQKLNLIFSLQLLATVILIFSETTFELYSYIVHWQGEVHITFDRHLLDVFLTSMLHYIIKITLIVWACETNKNQAQEIGTTICDVFNITRDEQIKGELQLFSLQIVHHKNIFSIKGLTMNATFLTAMVGNITTYMLILIQFLIASHSCEGKSVI